MKQNNPVRALAEKIAPARNQQGEVRDHSRLLFFHDPAPSILRTRSPASAQPPHISGTYNRSTSTGKCEILVKYLSLTPMISSRDFDHFLKHGFIEQLPPGSPMSLLLDRYGSENWYAKHVENNGLIYGIIKVGITEFHIYNEVLFGISHRPDLPFYKKEYRGTTMPWICNHRKILAIKERLERKNIRYNHYRVKGPHKQLKTAGATFFPSNTPSESTFIDTEGGVTFVFGKDPQSRRQEAIQICKYYDPFNR